MVPVDGTTVAPGPPATRAVTSQAGESGNQSAGR